MRLFHATDDEGAQGIRVHGFAKSRVRDSAGCAWLADAREGATTGSADRTWLVIIDMPDEIAEAHRYRFRDGTPYLGNFCMPFEVVNRYRPFTFERTS